jgi:hypothetical protein
MVFVTSRASMRSLRANAVRFIGEVPGFMGERRIMLRCSLCAETA